MNINLFIKYKPRNKILNLTRISKQLYYQRYFENKLQNIRKSWEGINNLIYRKSKKQKRTHKIKDLESNGTTVKQRCQNKQHSQQTFCLGRTQVSKPITLFIM